MNNPAFIVDGFTEKLIIQKLCPGKPIARTDLNGKNVTIDAIAKKIATLIRLYNNRYYPIIILIDREDREQSADDIAKLLNEKLHQNNIGNCDIRIGVADRMIENWIISDWEKLNKDNKAPVNIDGINGCAKLKEILGSYGKTTDGVELFLNADPEIVYKCSKSYRMFVEKLTDVDCGYLNRISKNVRLEFNDN